MNRACLGPLALAAACCLLLSACGTSGASDYEPDVASLPGDTYEQKEYPKGPYGSDKGSVLADMSFSVAFFDPAMMCKTPLEWKLGTTGPQSISFEQLYQGNPLCPNSGKSKLLLITTTPT